MKDISNLTFCQFVDSARVLKDNYECLLMPFFRVKEIKCWKTMIYSLDMVEWKRDKIWSYLNGDMEYDELVKLRNIK